MNPARSPITTGHLVQGGGERLQVVDHVLLGDDRADQLDQLLHRRRVEEVHADDLAGAPGAHRQLGDRQRRGVGREDRVGPADLVQLGEHLGLELQALRDRLDHQVGVGEVGQRGAWW